MKRLHLGTLVAAAHTFCATGAELGAPLTFLRAQGQDIVNERGDKIRFRGVGLGNWMLPEGYMWKFGAHGDRPRKIEKLVSDLIGPEDGKRFWAEFRQNYITESDIRRVAELGYNSVRPALNSRLFLSDAGAHTGTEEGFVLLDNLVGWSRKHGVYVIIDMHGAPGGQTGQNIDDSANDQPELFMDPKYQDQLVALWTTLARRYRDEPTVAGYDLLNEPLPERTGAAKTYKAQLEPLYKRITKAIREVDPKHLIILEGADWSNDWTVFSKPFDKNLVYQFHYYCWDSPAVLKDIKQFLDYRARWNAPVWVGETGERDSTIYWGTTQYFEHCNIGWSFWPWKKMDTQNTPFSIKRPGNWDAIVAYSEGRKKPEREIAQKAFDELLKNIRIENCTYHPDVVNAMLRQAPARIEAENYGHEGLNSSYFVERTNQLSKQYRLTEPVPINSGQSARRRSEQFATLKAGEWLAYDIWSATAKNYAILVRAKSAGGPTETQITGGGAPVTLTISSTNWTEIRPGDVTLNPGTNRLQWVVKQGTADLDWIELQ